jgi:hypothetical protein
MARELSAEEYEGAILGALAAAPAVPTSTLKQILKKRGWTDEQVRTGIDLARALSARNRAYRWARSASEIFFAQDPLATLDGLAGELLRDGPVPAAAFKQRLQGAAPGHKALVPEWLKGALARRVLFEHAAQNGSAQRAKAAKTSKFYGARPDLNTLLKKTQTALRSEVARADALNVSRQELLQHLARELGVSVSAAAHAPPKLEPKRERELLLEELQLLAARHPPGALFAVQELRALSSLDKARLDHAALALAAEGKVVLHHHDHPKALPEAERQLLIEDERGTHYVGIAFKRGAELT